MTPTYRQVPTAWLKNYSQNARVHPPEQIDLLVDSIRTFGFNAPVVAAKNGEILAGHARVEAARKVGLTELPCMIVEHLTEEQTRAYILADNRISELGGWDFEILHTELDWLSEGGFDIGVTGWKRDLGVIESDPDEGPDSITSDAEGGGQLPSSGGPSRPRKGDMAEIIIQVPAVNAPAVKRWLANGEYTVSLGYGKGVMRRMGLLDCGAREGYQPTGEEEDLDFQEDMPDWIKTGGVQDWR